MKIPPFQGLGVALITPFDKNCKVDFNALHKIIDNVINNGADYLVLLGTTAESPTLSQDEKNEILNDCLQYVNGRVKLIANFGGNDTFQLLKDLEYFEADRFDGIMCATPHYNKPNQKGVNKHFSEIANYLNHQPLILYNVPSRTGIMIHWETAVDLAVKHTNIVAIKEASADFDHINLLMLNKPEHFTVISGDDESTYIINMLGGNGVISVTANIIPKIVSKMLKEIEQGNNKNALKMHLKQINFVNSLFKESNPVGIKAIMHNLGWIEDNLRLPLTSMDSDLLKVLVSEYKALSLWFESN